MFNLTSRPMVWIPVKWKSLAPPADDPTALAVPVEHTVELYVELLDRDEFNFRFTTKLDEQGNEADDNETFGRVVKNWRKIVADAGEPIPFTEENARLLMQYPGFVGGFGRCYFAEWIAQNETREGNSEGSPANGRTDGPSGVTATDSPKSPN